MADLYTITDAGITIADWTTIQKSTLDAYTQPVDQGGFGSGADVTPDSPMYKIASPINRQTASVLQGMRDLSAQQDPQSAFGLQLDRLGSLIGLRRRGATRSTIPARLIGTPGTAVPAGAIVRYKPTGSRWQLAQAAVIGPAGTVEVGLFSLDFGPVDAPQAGQGDWQIVGGQVLGWDNVDSIDAAQLGALRETDAEYRARFAEAAIGLCTYEAIVNRLRSVTNVSAVYLYVNTKLTYDDALQLDGKQMRAVVQGGLKEGIILALHQSLGAPVDTAGSVEGSVNPGNGQVLSYRYDRLKRRRAYLKLTITGGNPAAPLPANASALVLAAIAKTTSPVGPFLPFLYGLAAIAALPVGSVTKIVAEGRLDPLDPWVEDAIPLGIAEYAEVSSKPSPAIAVADNTFPYVVGAGTFRASIDGGAVDVVSSVDEVTSGPLAFAELLADPVDGLAGTVVDIVDSRVRISTLSVGGTASIQLDGGILTGALFDNPLALFEGTDNDITLVINP